MSTPNRMYACGRWTTTGGDQLDDAGPTRANVLLCRGPPQCTIPFQIEKSDLKITLFCVLWNALVVQKEADAANAERVSADGRCGASLRKHAAHLYVLNLWQRENRINAALGFSKCKRLGMYRNDTYIKANPRVLHFNLCTAFI